MPALEANPFVEAHRVVIKIGTNALTNRSGRFDEVHFHKLAAAIVGLATTREVIVVSSGAIALGVERLGLPRRPKDVAGKQACAAVGQSRLMFAWEHALKPRAVAQVLLTHDDVQSRQRYLNARNAIERLLEHRVVPIINENDTVAVDEIRFGDNDRLAGVVTGLVNAQALVILSDVEGLFDADPRQQDNARLIREVRALTPQIWAQAGKSRSGVGTGGMLTKLNAADLAMSSGAWCAIAPGHRPESLTELFDGLQVGTRFVPRKKTPAARRRWIAQALRTAGMLEVDDGAYRALAFQKKSLLPAGIVRVSGRFRQGDLVELCFEGKSFARGLVQYDSVALESVLSQRAKGQAAVSTSERPKEAIHRDHLVLDDLEST
jgi:glutamate 5-kinase